MSNRMPSLAALLGLVAIAGYQNRDKIGDFIKDCRTPTPPERSRAAQPPRRGPNRGTDMAGSGYARRLGPGRPW